MSDVTTIEADVPERYADAVSKRLQAAGDERTSSSGSGAATARCGRRRARRRSPTGSAGSTSPTALREQLDELRRVRRRGPRRRLPDAVRAGHGRLEPRARGLPAQSFGDARRGLTLHVLDSTHPRAGAARCSTRVDLDKALMIVSSKSGGTIEPILDVQGLPRPPAATATHFVAVTDPGTSLEKLAQRARLPRASSTATRTSAAATARCRRSGSCPPCVAGIDIGAVLDSAIGAAEECRAEHGNAGLWLGCALGELARQGRDKLTFVADAPLDALRHLGRAARRRVHRQARHGHPPDRRRAAAGPRAPTATTASSCTSRTATPRTRAGSPTLQRRRPPGDHDPRARPDRPRPDLLPRGVRGRGRRLGAGDQPVRPAQRARGQGQHQPGAQGGLRRTSTDGEPERADRRPGAAGATSRSWATCRTRPRPRRRSRGCARR